MAPYRHFADKEALLAAVAEYGFRELAARLTAATATAADPRAGLAALGVAYVLFACDYPSLFKLFEGDSDGGDVSLACWSLVHGLSALIVDGRLTEHDCGLAEAVATRLTRLLSDSLAALGDRKPGGTPSNGDKHSLRKRRRVKPINSLTAG